MGLRPTDVHDKLIILWLNFGIYNELIIHYDSFNSEIHQYIYIKEGIYKLMRKIGSQTHKTTKSYINRLFTSFEPFYKWFRRFIIWCKIKEAKSYHINLRSPICKPKIKHPDITCLHQNSCLLMLQWLCRICCFNKSNCWLTQTITKGKWRKEPTRLHRRTWIFSKSQSKNMHIPIYWTIS